MHGMQGLLAPFFDNLLKTLKKLVWKHMKFYTVTHYITSSATDIIFPMNCQNTSLKYKKEFKQNLYMHHLLEKMEIIFQITEKNY